MVRCQLKVEYRRLEKILPTAWLSEQGADIASRAIASILADIAADNEHPVRQSFDGYLHQFIQDMESDPAMISKLAGKKNLSEQPVRQLWFPNLLTLSICQILGTSLGVP